MSTVGKKTEAVTIKGTAGGLLIRLRDDANAPFAELLTELDERLQAGDRFFRSGRASVELGARILEQTDLEALQSALIRYQITLETLISGANSTRTLAKQAGLQYRLPNSQNTRVAGPKVEGGVEAERGQSFDSAEALFLRRTLRSGQRIEHHADVIVLGDVNPGAEIIAGGSVVVWGTVRGKIQAGVVASKTVSSKAVICALSLRPTQLIIGEVVAAGNSEANNDPDLGPEMASVQDDAIVVESWMPHRARFRR